MALVMDDTSNGTIKHFSILWKETCVFVFFKQTLQLNLETYLKNRSPGYCMYIISRFVHSVSDKFLHSKPAAVPPNTATIVRMVRLFSRMNTLNFDMMICW